jgi:serine/threonine protein kinase
MHCIVLNMLLGKKNYETFKQFPFQDYEVLNLLGKGGFASVYRARCLKTGIEVAVKMVLKYRVHL